MPDNQNCFPESVIPISSLSDIACDIYKRFVYINLCSLFN